MGRPVGDRQEHVVGACATERGADGVGTSSSTRQFSCWPLATLGTTRQSASSGSVTLGCGDSTLGRWVVCLAAGVASTLLRCAFAFATLLFAIAILVKRLLTFFNASASRFLPRYCLGVPLQVAVLLRQRGIQVRLSGW